MKKVLTGIAFIYVCINIFAIINGVSLYDSLIKVYILLGLAVTLLIVILIINLTINNKVDLANSLKELFDFIFKGIIAYTIISIGVYTWNIEIQEGFWELMKRISIVLLGFSILILLFIYELNKRNRREKGKFLKG